MESTMRVTTSKMIGVAIAASLLAACGPVDPNQDPLGLGGKPGTKQPGPATTEETVAEAEPNNGPDLSGLQSLGALDRARTIKLSGKLETAGNDGSRYTGDLDGFLLEAPEDGGSLTVTVSWTGDADVDAAVYDAALNPIAGDGASARPITAQLTAAKGKLAVVLASKDKPADWTMTISYQPAAKSTGTAPAASGGSCTSPLQENPGGGCTMEMVGPANGQQLTMPATFGFKTLGCETPIKIRIFGNPPTPENSFSYSMSRGSLPPGQWFMKSKDITAEDLASLSSDNGTYHWQLESWHGWRTAGRTFTLAPAVCK
jgi:hypothetical protein